jgi:hypothetical protein
LKAAKRTKSGLLVEAVVSAQYFDFLLLTQVIDDLKSGKIDPSERLKWVGTTDDGVPIYVLAVGQWRAGFLDRADTWTLLPDSIVLAGSAKN